MARTARLTARYFAALARLRIHGTSPQGRALARTIAVLSSDERLPGPADSECAIPPTHRAYVRRVQNQNLWLWYVLTETEVVVVALTATPPMPVL